MELLILVILLVIVSIYFILSRNIENFDDIEILTSNVNDGNILSESINKDKINQIIRMNNYINDNKNLIPEEFRYLPKDILNRNMLITLIYDFYIVNFVDKYIVNRFNAHKFLKINYYYPNFNIFKENKKSYKEKSLEKAYNELINPTIQNMDNIDTLDEDFYLYSIKDIDNNLISKLEKNNKIDKFRQFYNGSNFRSFISKVLNNLNFKGSDSNLERFYIFEFIELNDNNIMDIFEIVNDIVDNELYLHQKYNLS